MDLLTEARRLGELVAWRHNKEAETGTTDAREATMIRDAWERLEVIADTIGEAAEAAFAEGYDATIDFSLNTDWRHDNQPTAEAADDDPNSLEW